MTIKVSDAQKMRLMSSLSDMEREYLMSISSNAIIAHGDKPLEFICGNVVDGFDNHFITMIDGVATLNHNLPPQPIIVRCACGAINNLTITPYCTECLTNLTPPEDI